MDSNHDGMDPIIYIIIHKAIIDTIIKKKIYQNWIIFKKLFYLFYL
jgi:hypothetical protein